MLAADWWWIAPAAAGAGIVASVGLRRAQRSSGRRLAVDAARADLKQAQSQVGEQRRLLTLARADYSRALAEQRASRAGSAAVASARRAMKRAEQNARLAAAEVRARRAHLRVAQAEVPPASQIDRYPLARLHSTHDAIIARWMDYETDPAKLIAYPMMSDGKDPAMAAFLAAARDARDLRPSTASGLSTEAYTQYREAVTRLGRTFDIAEHTAQARAAGRNPHAATAWQESAQELFTRSAEAIDRASAAAASAFEAWAARRKPKD